MDLLPLSIRTILIYFTVLVVMRLMGKREIGKLSVFDLVISIMIAEIAVFVLEDIARPMTDGIVPIAVLVIIQLVTAHLSLKSQTIRAWLDGKPSVLIRDGKLDREEMSRQRYNLDDLLLQLRQNKVLNVADVEFAILETSGKLTVVEKDRIGDKDKVKEKDQTAHTRESKRKSATDELPVDLFDTVRFEGLPLPLIMDGKVQDENLAKLGKTRFWLKNRIQQEGVREFKEVFFCSMDHRGRVFLDKKRK